MAARIMVVDDTQEILALFREILEDEGYEVHLHAYAIQDLAAIARVAPDLLILDLVLTDERSGWQLLQKLQMRPATAALPVVICTATLRQVEELEGHLKALGVEVVLKPFGIEELLGAARLPGLRAGARRGAAGAHRQARRARDPLAVPRLRRARRQRGRPAGRLPPGTGGG